jgi:hypothetical protein
MRFSRVRVAFFTLLLVGVLVPAAVRAQGDEPGRGPSDCRQARNCQPVEVEHLSTVYAHGQAFYLPCGDVTCPASLPHVKVTVLRSVAKTLGLHSTTIAEGAAAGPSRTNDSSIDDTSKSYYFIPLKASVERAMKKKKVSSMDPVASGSVPNLDGSVYQFKSTLVSWSFDGNCSGRKLHIKRRLTYGGHCVAR